MPDFAITVSTGPHDNPHGALVALNPSDPVGSYKVALDEMPRGLEAWHASGVFADGHRCNEAWLRACSIAADVDFQDEDGKTKNVAAPQEELARLSMAIPSCPANLYYRTAKGMRPIAVLSAPVKDLELYRRAAQGFSAILDRWLKRNRINGEPSAKLPGFNVDPATHKPAQYMFGPRAFVKGIQRNAEVVVLDPKLLELEALLAAAPVSEKAAEPKRLPRSNHGRGLEALIAAEKAYIAENTPADKFGRGGSRPCPACCEEGGCPCFGGIEGDGRWFCFNTDHPAGCGTKRDDGYLGNVLDLDAYAAHRTTQEHLIATGYWTPTPAREEPPPPGDEHAPAGTDESPEPGARDEQNWADGHLTDLGNSRRLVELARGNLMHVHELGWLVYDGTRWARDTTGEVARMAREVARSWYATAAETARQASEEQSADRAKTLAKISGAQNAWGRKTESDAKITPMLHLAQSEPEIAARFEELDAKTSLLGCKNGTLDLSTFTLRQADREDMITRVTGAAYDPAASCPLFDAFLARILPDPEVRGFLLRWAGYCLTAETGEHVLVVLHGTGANGKSTLIETLGHVLGDYFVSANPELLISRDRPAHPTERMTLLGRRLAVCSESERSGSLSESRVKTLTGGNTVNARLMGRDEINFRPTFKLALETNNRPRVYGTDEGIWRRMVLVPFTVTIPEGERDKALPEKLQRESAGILRALVEGCREWRRIGLGPPAAVRDATLSYRDQEDVLGQFIDQACVLSRTARVSSSSLFQAYSSWCEQNGERPMSQRGFSMRMEERNVEKSRTSAEKVWLGIGLRVPDSAGSYRRSLETLSLVTREGEF